MAAKELPMIPVLPIAALLLVPAADAGDAPSQDAPRQCWLDAMTDAEKRALVLGMVRVQQTEGKARAAEWVQEQREAYTRKSEAAGICPSSAEKGDRPPPPAGRSDEPVLLNRQGQPCRRIEMENQNVPNIGGSMGWALVQVCKD
jgi:hypothetical protein